MPKKLRLPKSARLEVIVSIFTNDSLSDSLNLIAKSGANGITTQQLVQRLNCSLARAQHILRALEDAGFISGTPPRGPDRKPRAHYPVVYRLNRPSVESAVDRFRAHLLGELDPITDEPVSAPQ